MHVREGAQHAEESIRESHRLQHSAQDQEQVFSRIEEPKTWVQ